MTAASIATYPVTYFVDRFGTLIPASGTDQANWNTDEAKRVRTVTSEDQGRRICVTIGPWYTSQKSCRPFLEAVAWAAAEAAKIEAAGHWIRRARPDCDGREFADLMHWPAPGPKPGPGSNLVSALRLVMVDGWSIATAAKEAGMSQAGRDRGHKTTTNGTRQLQRALKAWRARLAEMRRMSAMAA